MVTAHLTLSIFCCIQHVHAFHTLNVLFYDRILGRYIPFVGTNSLLGHLFGICQHRLSFNADTKQQCLSCLSQVVLYYQDMISKQHNSGRYICKIYIYIYIFRQISSKHIIFSRRKTFFVVHYIFSVCPQLLQTVAI